MPISKEANPRQKLLELIAKKGPITIKDLRHDTGISVGSLYHHLSKLEQYVIQDEQKRYLLSQQGREFFEKQDLLKVQKQPWYVSFIIPAIQSKYASLITIIAVLQLYLLVYVDSSQILLLPVKHSSVIESIFFGLILSILVAEGFSIASGAKIGHGILALAAGISLSTIPVVTLSWIDNVYVSIPLYVITILIASAALSSAKDLSYASSIAIALSVLLISIVVFMIRLGPIIILPISITIVLLTLTRLGFFEMIATERRTK